MGKTEDPLYSRAIKEVSPYDRVSASFLQRRFGIYYARAVKLMNLLEEKGIVGPIEKGSLVREVLHKKTPK